MTATFVDYQGETIALITARPNYANPPQVGLSFPTGVDRHPISARESRRTFAHSARYTLKFLSTLRTVADLAELRILLNQLTTQTVAVPLWTDACRLTADANAGTQTIALAQHPVRSGAAWIILNSDASVYEIATSDSVSANSIHLTAGVTNNWPAGTLMFPLLFGRLTERPEIESITPSRGDVLFSFKESSAYARRLNQYPETTPTVGAHVPNLSSLPLWPVQPNWSRVMDRTEVDTIFELIGFGRQDAAREYGRPIARGLEMEFNCANRDAIATIEKFFADRRGQVSTFMIPTFRNDLQLSADLPIGGQPRRITIAANEYSDAGRTPHPGDPYIALIDAAAGGTHGEITIDPHKITNVAGGTLTTAADVTQSHFAATTRACFLLLARLVESQLQWTYTDNLHATCRLKFIELPDEYTAPSPVLKEPVFLFRFTERQKYQRAWLFTSYEDVFTVAAGDMAGTFTPAAFEWSSLRQSLDADQTQFTLKSVPFTGNPLALFYPRQLEGPLWCELWEANAADPSELPRYRASGQVRNVKPDLSTADVSRFGVLLSRKVPRHIYSGIDDTNFDLTAFKVTGTLSLIDGTEIHVTSVTANGKAADYFAEGGFIEIGNSATTFERREILHSEPITGGVLLIIDEPLIKTTATGVAIDLFPGYDGTIGQREGRFSARDSFPNYPYAPTTSPAVKAAKPKNNGSGKK